MGGAVGESLQDLSVYEGSRGMRRRDCPSIQAQQELKQAASGLSSGCSLLA